jgi:2-keto-4-pentenoate hydratase
MSDKIEKLARALANAWNTDSTIPLPSLHDAPASRAEAYQVQDRMAELIGKPVGGWKVGATVKAVQQFEGHDGAIPGRIFKDRIFQSGAQVPAKQLKGTKLEAEFAFRLTKDFGPGDAPVTRESIAKSIVFVPALELTGSRYAPGTGNRGARTFDGIADNGSGGAIVVGPDIADWQKLDFDNMVVACSIDDSPAIQAYSGPYRRDPATVTAETLNDLAARGVSLKAGDVILTGSLTLPTPLRPGQTVTAKYADLATITMKLV